jgi:molybdenum ABC transporter molybdate-binding protein
MTRRRQIELLRQRNPVFLAVAGSALLLVGLGLLLARNPLSREASGKTELLVYCAAGLQPAVDPIAREYERQYGASIRLMYGGSNTLLSQLEVAGRGDLYLAADDAYLALAEEKKLLAETLPIARMTPVLIVPRENSKRVTGVADLLRDDVRVALANPDQAAVGKVTRECLQKINQWDALEARVRQSGVFKPTVNDVATDVAVGSVDAGVVWDAVAAQFPRVQVIRAPELEAGRVQVSLGVLKTTKVPTQALRFARFLTASDRGLEVFRAHGFEPIAGDRWSERPQLTLFAGAVNRAALEATIAAFEERNGVDVQTVYNGCGILTAQMRATSGETSPEVPDAFMACDVYYMDVVRDLFADPVEISQTPIVIAVQRGNPKGIASLADLARPGVRVALGQPDQCTIGVLSRRLLESVNLYQRVLENNVVTQTATSSLLLPSIVTGSADAALVYRSDAQAEPQKVQYVRIDSPLAGAIQPFAMARSSEHQQLGRQLLRAIGNSRAAFEAAGFNWRFDDK